MKNVDLREHCQWASDIVKTWPKWKQNLLRDSLKPTRSTPRTTGKRLNLKNNISYIGTNRNTTNKFAESYHRFICEHNQLQTNEILIYEHRKYGKLKFSCEVNGHKIECVECYNIEYECNEIPRIGIKYLINSETELDEKSLITPFNNITKKEMPFLDRDRYCSIYIESIPTKFMVFYEQEN